MDDTPPAPLLPPGLYVTATPIGNLKDITLRALEVLRGAAVIYCEDTRVTGKLCAAHGITTPLRPYHDHNGDRLRPEILDRLAAGAAVALVSDAGTPLISDPGYKLVRAAREAGHRVVTVPGASALTAAISIAGLPTDRFLFAGFLPAKQGARTTEIKALQAIPATLAFYETGPRLAATLTDLAAILGPREAAVARELTKLHEEVVRGTLPDLAARYDQAPPKGEIVLLVAGAEAAQYDEAAVRAILADLLATEKVKDAATIAAEQTGWPRKALYDLALEIKNG